MPLWIIRGGGYYPHCMSLCDKPLGHLTCIFPDAGKFWCVIYANDQNAHAKFCARPQPSNRPVCICCPTIRSERTNHESTKSARPPKQPIEAAWSVDPALQIF